MIVFPRGPSKIQMFLSSIFLVIAHIFDSSFLLEQKKVYQMFSRSFCTPRMLIMEQACSIALTNGNEEAITLVKHIAVGDRLFLGMQDFNSVQI